MMHSSATLGNMMPPSTTVALSRMRNPGFCLKTHYDELSIEG